ncbi:hypothetical protein H8B02_40060 [Bradyrhizobium sp. Pear77]|uniref:hypothetical protein n=1 Tax=Bradyrhizobium altum TaxID=1571202 RepID=UPI001E55C242|nr:hypothetical protein [Bradyrhizobium altum]MCC8959380.1 hypothetical protein [Bradyrhizobium altum]
MNQLASVSLKNLAPYAMIATGFVMVLAGLIARSRQKRFEAELEKSGAETTKTEDDTRSAFTEREPTPIRAPGSSRGSGLMTSRHRDAVLLARIGFLGLLGELVCRIDRSVIRPASFLRHGIERNSTGQPELIPG